MEENILITSRVTPAAALQERGRLTLVLAMALLSSIALSHAEGREAADLVQETHHSKGKSGLTYAIYRSASGNNSTALLYYFHGTGGDENSWRQSCAGAMAEWERRGIKPPVVVAVTFGSEWLMYPEEASTRAVALEGFVRDSMPEIEAAVGGTVGRRLLFGFSIGGANVAQLLFRYPELFDRAVIASPMIYPFPIYEPQAGIDAFIKGVEEKVRPDSFLDWIKMRIFRHDVVRNCILGAVATIRWYVRDPEAWARADILSNMKSPPRGRRIPVYISSGRHDVNGFFPGSELLGELASARGYYAVFDPIDGGHLSLDLARIADFLAE